MATKVVITGGMGFIGSNLNSALLMNPDISGCVIADRSNGLDVFSPQMDEIVKNNDVVYHLAAQTSVSQSFDHPEDFYYTNIFGTAHIAQLCAKYQKKLIYPSSASVLHQELSPYAESKKIVEDMLLKFKDAFPIVILRLFNVFGPGMNDKTGSIISRFLHDDPITIYGSGEQTRDYIHIRDVVAIMIDAIKDKWDGRLVEVGTGEAYSTNYIAETFAQCRKVEIEYKAPRREVKWSVANTTELMSLYDKKLTTNVGMDIEELCLHQ